jgi:hypothetical protein
LACSLLLIAFAVWRLPVGQCEQRAHYRLEQLRAQQLHEERARQRDTESTAAFGVTRCERCGRVDAHDHGDSR